MECAVRGVQAGPLVLLGHHAEVITPSATALAGATGAGGTWLGQSPAP